MLNDLIAELEHSRGKESNLDEILKKVFFKNEDNLLDITRHPNYKDYKVVLEIVNNAFSGQEIMNFPISTKEDYDFLIDIYRSQVDMLKQNKDTADDMLNNVIKTISKDNKISKKDYLNAFMENIRNLGRDNIKTSIGDDGIKELYQAVKKYLPHERLMPGIIGASVLCAAGIGAGYAFSKSQINKNAQAQAENV